MATVGALSVTPPTVMTCPRWGSCASVQAVETVPRRSLTPPETAKPTAGGRTAPSSRELLHSAHHLVPLVGKPGTVGKTTCAQWQYPPPPVRSSIKTHHREPDPAALPAIAKSSPICFRTRRTEPTRQTVRSAAIMLATIREVNVLAAANHGITIRKRQTRRFFRQKPPIRGGTRCATAILSGFNANAMIRLHSGRRRIHRRPRNDLSPPAIPQPTNRADDTPHSHQPEQHASLPRPVPTTIRTEVPAPPKQLPRGMDTSMI